MGTLTVALNDQLRYTIGPPLADEIGRKVLGKGEAALVLARDVLKAGGDELNLTPWQLGQVLEAIEQLEEERFAEGERTMSEAEQHDLYEPAGYVANEPIDRRHLVDQLAAVVAAAWRPC